MAIEVIHIALKIPVAGKYLIVAEIRKWADKVWGGSC